MRSTPMALQIKTRGPHQTPCQYLLHKESQLVSVSKCVDTVDTSSEQIGTKFYAS